MFIIINSKKIRIKNCKKFKDRLIGMMFKKHSNICFLFPHCNSIHTFFMVQSIDVFMTDKNNNILYKYINLKPFKIILPKKNVANIYEFPSGLIDHNLDKIIIE